MDGLTSQNVMPVDGEGLPERRSWFGFTETQWRSEGPAGPAGGGAEGARQGPPGRSSRRNPLARGPNKLLAGGPKIVATPLLKLSYPGVFSFLQLLILTGHWAPNYIIGIN